MIKNVNTILSAFGRLDSRRSNLRDGCSNAKLILTENKPIWKCINIAGCCSRVRQYLLTARDYLSEIPLAIRSGSGIIMDDRIDRTCGRLPNWSVNSRSRLSVQWHVNQYHCYNNYRLSIELVFVGGGGLRRDLTLEMKFLDVLTDPECI